MEVIKNRMPAEDGFYMPGEFEHHRGCVMIWPVRPGSWTNGGAEAKLAFFDIASAISESEHVWMLADSDHIEEVELVFNGNSNVTAVNIETDDAWARDVGPTCVKKIYEENADGSNKSIIRAIDWQFNAWGGEYDGLYASWDKDDAAAKKIAECLKMDLYDAHPFVLEGGSIHSDGQGTVLVTEACLLSKGRNPSLTKEQIEERLKCYLGAEKIIWLPNGIYNDETNEHVDNVCAFVKPGVVVLAWTEDEKDPQYAMSLASLKVLEKECDARGRKFEIHKIPIPKENVTITEEDLNGFEFEEGEDVRTVGERLAASYVNFYISNGGVIIPQFGDENDKKAIDILSHLFDTRKIYPIDARAVIVGGGNIHCITQQIPD